MQQRPATIRDIDHTKSWALALLLGTDVLLHRRPKLGRNDPPPNNELRIVRPLSIDYVQQSKGRVEDARFVRDEITI